MDNIPKDMIRSRKQVLHTLSEVVKNAQLAPRSLELRTGEVHYDVNKPAGEGGFGTVYRGTLGSGQDQQKVCVKVTRKSPRESKDSATLLRVRLQSFPLAWTSSFLTLKCCRHMPRKRLFLRMLAI